MLEIVTDLISILGDPQRTLNSFPHPSMWPTLAQDAMRAYRVHEIAFYIGLFLVFIGAALSILSLYTGNGYRALLNLTLMAILGTVFTSPPAQECLPNSGYPCVVDKRVSLVPQSSVDFTTAKERLDFSGVSPNQGGTYRLPHESRKIELVSSPLVLPPYIKYEYKHPLPGIWEKIEPLWLSVAQGSTTTVAATLSKYQEQIRETQRQLRALFFTNVALGTVGMLGETAASLVINLAKDKPRWAKGTAAFGAGATAQGLNTGLAILAETIKLVAVLMALAPVFLMLSYGFVIAVAGFVFYAVVMLFPIFIGLGTIWGLGAVLLPLRLALLALTVPLIATPIVGASIHMIYGYNTSVKEFLETSGGDDGRKDLMDEFPWIGKPLDTFIEGHLVQLVVSQLRNTAICLSPYFYRNADGKFVRASTYGQGGSEGPKVAVGLEACNELQGDTITPPRKAGSLINPNQLTPSELMLVPAWSVNLNGASAETFYNDLMHFVGDPNSATVMELTTPLKLKQALRLMYRYGIQFSAPAITVYASGLSREIQEAVKRSGNELLRNISPTEINAVLSRLAQGINPSTLDANPRIKNMLKGAGSGPEIAPTPPPEAGGSAYVWQAVTRMAMAQEAGVSDAYLNAGGVAQTATAMLVSLGVSLVLSLVILGGVWGIAGMALETTLSGVRGAIEAPGFQPVEQVFRMR